MERTYLALIHKDPRQQLWGNSFPDFLGCTSVGSILLKKLVEMARAKLWPCCIWKEWPLMEQDIPPPGSPDAALAHEDAFDAIALIVVEALPERTEEEAQAELEAFLASDEYHEIYGNPLTEEELNNLPYYEDSVGIRGSQSRHWALRPVTGADTERIYAALVRQDAAGDFCVGFPDLPGCIANGHTLEQACKAARPVLARHLEDMATNGASIPNPSSASDVLTHPDGLDAVALIVVEALPERETSLASTEYREAYGEPVSTV